MKKNHLFPYLRLIPLLLLAPLLYWLWEKEGADVLLQSVRPASVEAIRVGTPAPDFQVKAKDVWSRKEFKLSSLRGYPVVLHFWATWCGPCLQELPELLKLADNLRKEGFSFVAIAIDQDWATLENFFRQHPDLAPLKDKMVLLLDPNAEIAAKYGSSRFPETFLINTDQVMDNKFIGAQAWNDPGMAVYLNNLRSTGR
jgi:cytochrome c biogenesis protein CcmG/thiol:disulfide interchange protein DsbE